MCARAHTHTTKRNENQTKHKERVKLHQCKVLPRFVRVFARFSIIAKQLPIRQHKVDLDLADVGQRRRQARQQHEDHFQIWRRRDVKLARLLFSCAAPRTRLQIERFGETHNVEESGFQRFDACSIQALLFLFRLSRQRVNQLTTTPAWRCSPLACTSN